MFYALWTYHWRAAAIRTGGRGPFDDRFGPVSYLVAVLPHCRTYCLVQTILCAALLGTLFICSRVRLALTGRKGAIIVNFVLRFTTPDL